MYIKLDQYDIAETNRLIKETSAPILAQFMSLFDEMCKTGGSAPLMVLCLNDLIKPFKHLSMDEDYDIFCYVTREYHGSFGRSAAVKRGEDHSANCIKGMFPTIILPPGSVDPMEVIYCDGTPEGYLEAVHYHKCLNGVPRYQHQNRDQGAILFGRPPELTPEWDFLINVDDWCPKVKGSALYLYMYVSGFRIGEPNGRDYIRLKCYDFSDQLELVRAIVEKSDYPAQLPGRGRYGNGKHCCVYHMQSIDIAKEPDER